jgi:hypothetical protein
MQRPWWLILVLSGMLATLAVGAERDDLERNRQLLERWRADPEHYQRLRRDLKAFYALPPARQEQIRQLDRRLHEGDLTTQTRLWTVLERYNSWLGNLAEGDRQRVMDAEDTKTRLQIIREIRDRQWAESLPSTLREQLTKLAKDKQQARLVQLREEERRERLHARTGKRAKEQTNLRPTRTSEFPPEVQTYLERLKRRLGDEEKQRLAQAEGKWPDLPRTVRELADLHPALPPLPSGAIVKYGDLPQKVKNTADRRKLKPLQRVSGRWPAYALGVARLMKNENLPCPPLGASILEQLPPSSREFVKQQLLPKLTSAQQDALKKAEGRWPEYPQLLLRLAREKHLVIPEMSLPGPVELWENTRLALPEVPDHLLMQFALHESTPEDRAEWELNTADPMGSRKKVKEAWYRKKLEQERKRQRSNSFLDAKRD